MPREAGKDRRESMTDVITKVFCDGDEMPLRIHVPVKFPIADAETTNFTLRDCYTTGKSVGYRLGQVRYGLHGVVFGDYVPARRGKE